MADATNNPIVRLYWQNASGLSPDQINAALAGVQKLYAPLNIQYAPLSTLGDSAQPDYTVVFAKQPFKGQTDDANGAAYGNRAYVYVDPLSNFGTQEPQALEYATAHELGHMLGLQHRQSGVMYPNINTTSLGQDLFVPAKQDQRAIQYLAKRGTVKLSDLAGGQ